MSSTFPFVCVNEQKNKDKKKDEFDVINRISMGLLGL